MDTREFAPEDEDLRGVGRRLVGTYMPRGKRGTYTARVIGWIERTSIEDVLSAVSEANGDHNPLTSRARVAAIRIKEFRAVGIGHRWTLRNYQGVGEAVANALSQAYLFAAYRRAGLADRERCL